MYKYNKNSSYLLIKWIRESRSFLSPWSSLLLNKMGQGQFPGPYAKGTARLELWCYYIPLSSPHPQRGWPILHQNYVNSMLTGKPHGPTCASSQICAMALFTSLVKIGHTKVLPFSVGKKKKKSRLQKVLTSRQFFSQMSSSSSYILMLTSTSTI